MSRLGAPASGNRKAAAAAAAHAVLSGVFPAQQALYDAQLSSDLSGLHGGTVAAGQAWGETVGAAVVSMRAADGSSPAIVQPGSTNVGEFRADFGSSQYRSMAPFAIASAATYFSGGPPALTSPEYAAAFTEVKLLGDASYANTSYDEIFRFWRGGGGSARPPGEWIKIALVVAEQEGTTSSLSETARLFALLGMALGDATIPTWENKAGNHFWRPTTAVQNASADGNPLTIEDAGWAPRNGSAGSSPEYTSGQSAYAGAGSTVLASFYCTDAIAFSFEGDDAVAGTRSFAAFSEAAREAGQARIFAGIHFQFSNQDGQSLGRAVAREVVGTALHKAGSTGGPDCVSPGRRR